MLSIKFENIQILNFSRIEKKTNKPKKYWKKYSIRKSYNHFQNYFIGNILIILRNITFMSNVMITRYIRILEKSEKMKSNNNCSFQGSNKKCHLPKSDLTMKWVRMKGENICYQYSCQCSCLHSPRKHYIITNLSWMRWYLDLNA